MLGFTENASTRVLETKLESGIDAQVHPFIDVPTQS